MFYDAVASVSFRISSEDTTNKVLYIYIVDVT
jgi:hypothetical protein